MLDPQLVAYLKDHAGLSALVDGRIYPDVLPDPHTLPALVYQRVSRPRDVTHDGPLPEAQSRYQIDVWGHSRKSVRTVALELSRALLGFSGYMGTTHVAIPSQPQEIDMYETETGYYRELTEFIIWHE